MKDKCECNQCGLCCKGLFISGIPEVEVWSRDSDPSIEFMREHWKVLSDEEGRKRAPWVTYPALFFECDQHTPDTGLCGCYDDRPRICSGYPFYDDRLKDLEEELPPGCGYRRSENGKEKDPERDRSVGLVGTQG